MRNSNRFLLFAMLIGSLSVSALSAQEFHIGIEYWGGGEYEPGYMPATVQADSILYDVNRSRPSVLYLTEGKANNPKASEDYPIYLKFFLPVADTVDFYAGYEYVSIAAPDVSENMIVTDDFITGSNSGSSLGFGQMNFEKNEITWQDREGGVNIDLDGVELLVFGGQRLIEQSAETSIFAIGQSTVGSSGSQGLGFRSRDFSHRIKNGLYGVGVTVPVSKYLDVYGKYTVGVNGSTDIDITSPYGVFQTIGTSSVAQYGFDFYKATYNLKSRGYEFGIKLDAGPGEVHIAYKREDFKSSYDSFISLAQASLTISNFGSTLANTPLPAGRRISDNYFYGQERKWHFGNVAIGYTFKFGED